MLYLINMKGKQNPFEGAAQLKSYDFAVRIVNTCNSIQKYHKEHIMSKQLIRCGTSIGANLQEGEGRQSGKDLLTKLHISYKEAKESRYWLCLLRDTKYLDDKECEKLLALNEEILRLIGSSIITLRKKLIYK